MSKHQQKIEKGQADGYASLDANAKLPATQLPDLSITNTFVVASEVEMLALVCETGDVAIRTDVSKSFILAGTDPTALSNWVELLFPEVDPLFTAANPAIQSHINSISNPHEVNSSQIDFPHEEVTTHLTVLNDFYNHSWSSTSTTGFDLTDNGDGTINISAGEVVLRDDNLNDAQLKSYAVAETLAVALTDNNINYVVVEYNAGTPIISVTNVVSEVNCWTNCLLYKITRIGTDLKWIDAREMGVDTPRKVRRMQIEVEGIRYAYGVGVSEVGTRNLYVNSGRFYYGINDITTPLIDTSVADTFTTIYGNFTRTTGQTQIDVTYYDNAGTLTALNPNKITNRWVYMVIDNPSKIYVVYGTQQYTKLSEAQAELPPANLPIEILGLGKLLARIVVEAGNNTFLSVDSYLKKAYTSGSVSDHGDLVGLGDDDHLNYPLLAGRVTGDNLVLQSVLGADFITNGDFATDLTGWSGTNWTWNSGTAKHSSGTTALTQAAATVVVGTVYKLTFDLIFSGTGSITPSCGGMNGLAHVASATGIVWYFTATATTALSFIPTTGNTSAIDNVKLQAISHGTLTVGDYITGATPGKSLRFIKSLINPVSNEVAFKFEYEVNKATSGNDSGLVINMIDTNSPGTSKVIDIQVNGVSVLSTSPAGQTTINNLVVGNVNGSSYLAGQRNNIQVNPTDGIMSNNNTAATAAIPVQMTPRLNLQGSVWNSGGTPATNTVNWTQDGLHTSGNPPTSTLRWGYSLAGAAFSYVMSLTSAGVLTVDKLIADGSFGELYLDESSIHTADSVAVTDGTITSGSVVDTRTINNTYLVINESGKFQVDVTFSGITGGLARIEIKGRYVGSFAHEVEIKIWDYNTSVWDDINATTKDLPSSTTDYSVQFLYPADTTNYVSGGEAKVRIEHTSVAVGTHNLYVDYIALIGKTHTVTTAGTFYDINALTGGESNDTTLSAANGTITVLTTGKYKVNVAGSFCGTPSAMFHFHAFVGSVEQGKIGAFVQKNSNGDFSNIELTGILNLTANDIVKLRFTALQDGAYVSFQYLNFNLTRIN